MSIVHVVGTGTIGLPLIGLLNRHKAEFGIKEVTFHKNTPLKNDIAGIRQLIKEGAILCTDKEKAEGFLELGVAPKYSREEAIKRASVVIDCTPKGFGIKNKSEYYDKFKKKGKGFIAQGSESGFGVPFAHGANNEAIGKKDQFIQVVSCNTHNISVLLDTMLSWGDIVDSDFVCVRRSSDISQDTEFSPGVAVDPHKDEFLGTHHAVDAHRLFETINKDIPIFSSACKINSQYMHTIRFKISVGLGYRCGYFPGVDHFHKKVLESFAENKNISLTEKKTSNRVFSFGRDYGHYGRLLTQTVVSVPSVHVGVRINPGTRVRDPKNPLYTMTVSGFCFTPQDGNSLLSSVAATLWYLHGDWGKVEKKMECLSPYLFDEI